MNTKAYKLVPPFLERRVVCHINTKTQKSLFWKIVLRKKSTAERKFMGTEILILALSLSLKCH